MRRSAASPRRVVRDRDQDQEREPQDARADDEDRQLRRTLQVHEDECHEQRLRDRDRQRDRRVPDPEVLERRPDRQRGEDHRRAEDAEVGLQGRMAAVVRVAVSAHSVCLPRR